MPEREIEFKALPIDWYIPDDMAAHYATNITSQYGEHEFIISFFEARPPIVLGTPEERRAKVGKTTSVQAVCVARVIVAPERMAGFIKALRENYDAYRHSVLGEEE